MVRALRIKTLLALGVLVLLALGFLATIPIATANSASPSPAGVATAPFPTPIQHVIEIFLENQGLTQVLSGGPYEKSIYSGYAGASEFYAICHPSAPNYLGVTSGTTLQCGSDAVNTYSDENIADLATSNGRTWNAYFEGMPSNCYKSESGLYEPHHNPFIYYSDISGACGSHDIAIGNLVSDFPFSTTPASYTWISPNMDNDGHNTGVAGADAWLSKFLPKLIAAPWFSTTAVFVQYDEACDGGTGCPATPDTSSYAALEQASGCESSPDGCGGHVYLAVVSPYTQGQGLYTSDATDWNVLCTEEWLLGLPSTGNEDCTGSFQAMKSMFNFASPPPSDYTVSGTIASTDGSAIAGASVSISGSHGSANTTTGAAGTYSAKLPNGTYTLDASASGFVDGSRSVTVSGSDLLGIDLALSPLRISTYSVSGTISGSGGSPVSGANVNISGSQGSAGATTHSSGTYSVKLPNGTYTLHASASGYAASSRSVTVAGSDLTGVDVALTPLGQRDYSVSGFIDGTGGKGIARATVHLSGADGSASATTGSNGGYSVSLPNGTYSLKASAPGFSDGSKSLTVAGNALTGVDVTLSPVGPGNYSISGAIVGANGTGLTGALVDVVGADGSAHTTAGTTGAYSVALPNGTYSLHATDAGFLGRDRNVTIDARNLTGINVTLEPLPNATYLVTGTVIDSILQTSVDNATVFANTTEGYLTTTTNATGRFAFELANGTYSLAALAASYLPFNTTLMISGSGVTNLVLALDEATGLWDLSGFVNASSTSLPISGAAVFANSTNNSYSAGTSVTGAYSVAIPNGQYQVTVLATGFEVEERNASINGTNVTGLDFNLNLPAPAAYSVQGTVLTAATNAPVQNAVVYANATYASLETSTNASGSFVFDLTNGTYLVSAQAPGFGPRSTNVTVSGANVSGISLVLVRPGPFAFPVDGVIVADNNGTPVSNASIEAEAPGYSAMTVSAPNGSFVINLPNGTYQFVVHAVGFVESEVNVTVLGQPVVGLAVPVSTVASGGSNSSTLILGVVVLVAVATFGAMGWWTGRRARLE